MQHEVRRVTIPGQKLKSRYGLRELWADTPTSHSDSMRVLVYHSLDQMWRRFRAAPLTLLFSTLALGVVLTIVGLAVALYSSSTSMISSQAAAVSVRLFPPDGASADALDALAREARADPSVATVIVRDKAAALQELREQLSDADALLEGLQTDNPLPASVELQLHPDGDAQSNIERLAAHYRKDPRVADVRYSSSLLGSLTTISRGVRTLGLAGLAVVTLLGVFIVVLTLRLALYAHRNEIEIMKLVGAPLRMLRAPFLLEALVQGLCAGIVAALICPLVFSVFQHVARQAELAWLLGESNSGLSPWIAVSTVILGPLVALFGSLLALRSLEE